MMSNFFNDDFINPLDFPNWQAIGSMDVEDMFERGNVETEDPSDMLPMMPRQSAIQDPAQEAFQFPFQFPMQDFSGGEGKQYAPVDVPENELQEMGMVNLVDETASETNQGMTQEQGILGDIELPELLGNVEKAMRGDLAATFETESMIDVEDMFGEARTAPSAMQEARAMMNPQDEAQALEESIPSSIESMYGVSMAEQTRQMMNPQGEAQAIEEPLWSTVESMYGVSAMQQSQRMMNPQNEPPSDEPIPQTVEQMYQTTYDEQVARNRMYDPESYDLKEPPNPADQMYDPEQYDLQEPVGIDPNKSIMLNLWNALEQQSLTEDWGLFGDILQEINPSQSLVGNLVDMAARSLSSANSPTATQAESLAESGTDTQAPAIVTGKIAEAAGLDTWSSSSLIEVIGSIIAKLL